MEDAVAMLKRQQAEIERLKTEKDNLIRNYKECAMEVVKDFADRIQAKHRDLGVSFITMAFVVNRIKVDIEMGIYSDTKKQEGNNAQE